MKKLLNKFHIILDISIITGTIISYGFYYHYVNQFTKYMDNNKKAAENVLVDKKYNELKEYRVLGEDSLRDSSILETDTNIRLYIPSKSIER